MPGTSRNTKQRKADKSKEDDDKCAGCKIEYNTAEDSAFRKGKLGPTAWIGCDSDSCKYWGHAICLGQNVKTEKEAKLLPFRCVKHSR